MTTIGCLLSSWSPTWITSRLVSNQFGIEWRAGRLWTVTGTGKVTREFGGR